MTASGLSAPSARPRNHRLPSPRPERVLGSALRLIGLQHPEARVVRVRVSNAQRVEDFEAAGIHLIDEQGRVADLHSLRSTLGTWLARAGVAPQVARRMMRHADYSTTLKHYTTLHLDDTRRAVDQLPTLTGSEKVSATGTLGVANEARQPTRNPQHIPQQSVHDSARQEARACDEGGGVSTEGDDHNPLTSAGSCDSPRDSAGEGVVPVQGLEPWTRGLRIRCSTRGEEGAPSRFPSSGVQEGSAQDPELAEVVAAWSALPAALRAGILAMVAAAVESRA